MTTPVPGQREGRENDVVFLRERLKHLSFVITGNDYAFFHATGVEVDKSLKKYRENAVQDANLASRRQALEEAKTHLHKRTHNPIIQGLITVAVDELLSGEVIPQAGEEGNIRIEGL